MDLAQPAQSASPLLRLRRLTQPRPPRERCELCGAAISAEHSHLLEPSNRQLHCACDACAILFSGQQDQRYRRVPRRVEHLPELESIEGLCESLHIPINLAFFYHSSDAGKLVAMYPSPAGATESLLPMDAWEALASKSDKLRQMQSDVEALIVNHIGKRRDCYLVSIDECYKLVGLIRSQWRGLSGGQEVWKAIAEFFDNLDARASRAGNSNHVGESAHA